MHEETACCTHIFLFISLAACVTGVEGDFVPLSPGLSDYPDLSPLSPVPVDEEYSPRLACDGTFRAIRCDGCDVVECKADGLGVKEFKVCPVGTHCECIGDDCWASCVPGNCSVIHVKSPFRFEEWHQNQTHIFRWQLHSRNMDYNLPKDLPLYIYFDDNEGGPFRLAQSLSSNTGWQEWSIPQDVEPGSYRVSIQAINDPTIYGFTYPVTFQDGRLLPQDTPEDTPDHSLVMMFTLGGSTLIILGVGIPMYLAKRRRRNGDSSNSLIKRLVSDPEHDKDTKINEDIVKSLPFQGHPAGAGDDGQQEFADGFTDETFDGLFIEQHMDGHMDERNDEHMYQHGGDQLSAENSAFSNYLGDADEDDNEAEDVQSSVTTGRRPRIVELRYGCNVCHRRFTRKGNLAVHMKNHSGLKRFKCDQCNKRFSKKQNLQTHISAMHTQDQPFQCDKCLRRFNRKGNLTRHLRTHMSKRPYPCPYCGKRFADVSNFKKHLQKHHPGKPHVKAVVDLSDIMPLPSQEGLYGGSKLASPTRRATNGKVEPSKKRTTWKHRRSVSKRSPSRLTAAKSVSKSEPPQVSDSTSKSSTSLKPYRYTSFDTSLKRKSSGSSTSSSSDGSRKVSSVSMVFISSADLPSPPDNQASQAARTSRILRPPLDDKMCTRSMDSSTTVSKISILAKNECRSKSRSVTPPLQRVAGTEQSLLRTSSDVANDNVGLYDAPKLKQESKQTKYLQIQKQIQKTEKGDIQGSEFLGNGFTSGNTVKSDVKPEELDSALISSQYNIMGSFNFDAPNLDHLTCNSDDEVDRVTSTVSTAPKLSLPQLSQVLRNNATLEQTIGSLVKNEHWISAPNFSGANHTHTQNLTTTVGATSLPVINYCPTQSFVHPPYQANMFSANASDDLWASRTLSGVAPMDFSAVPFTQVNVVTSEQGLQIQNSGVENHVLFHNRPRSGSSPSPNGFSFLEFLK